MTSAPSFLSPLLSPTSSSSPSPIPIYPIPTTSHSKPTFPALTSPIADSAFHPALEAALHLANGDLYSAHFLVRKGQGGRRELDWGHGLLHRLEGDWGNAKCWYTDVYALASSSSASPPPLFQTFWTSSPSPSGDSSVPALSSKLSHPSQYLDLLLLYSLLPPSFSSSSSSSPPEEADRTSLAERVYKTSHFAAKLQHVPHYSQSDLSGFLAQPSTLPFSRGEIEALAVHEVRTLALGCGERFGWEGQSMEKSVRAFEEQKGLHDEDGEEGGGGPGRVDHNAQGMVLGSTGNRKF